MTRTGPGTASVPSRIRAGPREAPGIALNARRATRMLVWITALGTFYLLLNLLHFPFGRDQGIFAMVADTFFEGGVPYRDAWDFKTPGIFFVFAAARGLLGQGELALRLFEGLVWLAMGSGIVLLSRQFVDWRAGAIGFAMAVLGLMTNGFWHVGQPESLAAALVVWAIALTHLNGSRRWAAWFAVAVLYSLAGFLKPTLVAGVFVSFAWVMARTVRAEGPAAWWRPTLAFAAGGAVSVLALWSWLQVSGAWPAFHDALFVYAPRYTALGHSDLSMPVLFGTGLFKYLAVWPILSMGSLLLLLERRDRLLMSATAHVLGVMLAILFGVALQAKFFYYHYGTVVALGGLLAGWGYWGLWQRLRLHRFALAAILALWAALALLPSEGRQFWKNNIHRLNALVQPSARNAIFDKLYRVHGFDIDAIRRTSAWLAGAAPPDDPTLFIWGFEPSIYLYSGLTPHNRFIYNAPMRAPWLRDDAMAEFRAAYDARKPWSIVVQSNDRLPRVTGDPRSSAEVLPEDFPMLRDIIARDYTLRQSFGPMAIYTLNEALPVQSASTGF